MDGEGTATLEFKLGKAIGDARRKAGLTQQELCIKANLSYSTLAKIERGAIKTPSVFTVAVIAKATGVSLEELAGVGDHFGPKTAQRAYKTAKNGIKFVYFDVNGVMVRFFQRAFTDIADDTGASADMIENLFWHHNDAICRGEMSLAEFNKLLAERTGVSEISWADYYLKNVDPITDIHDTLHWVASNYPVGLLTNAMPGLTRKLLQQGTIPNLDFSAIIDSSEVNCIKPEEAIYQKATQAAKTEPTDILLIDDSPPNLMAAEKLGWHVLRFDDYRPDESANRIRQALEF
jgi:FMN phosphatase YigB (HAD superfamily)/DNA-binding XRE family transcriptional regulator